ncbi:glycoside hydrolase family 88/105 protein [Flavisolibacter tropicus]|uniref:glycoside hydrolase family 88/105 protein n=1 Tax=Flavisolibacter tropicus TaxID=1492898 RepID=UPI0008306BC1|nr:glycoside hydrolase family 88 protein [Flavisolibacter tropicus]
MIKVFGATFFSCFVLSTMLVAQDSTALLLAKKVADKVIRETAFELQLVPQEAQLGMQVINFRHIAPQKGQVAYAFQQAYATGNRAANFGINSSGNVKVWVNKKLVYQQNEGKAGNPQEIAYGRFEFDHAFAADLTKGQNEILVSFEGGTGDPIIFIRPVLDNKDVDDAVKFDDAAKGDWRMAVFPATYSFQPTEPLRTHYAAGEKIIAWQAAPEAFLSELKINSNATYKRDSYADWNYANGATLWSMMALEDERYTQFVKKYSQFIIDNNAFFKWQYDSLSAYRGSFHRMFRLSMLDDSGTPSLPLVELYLKNKDSALRHLIDPIANYVSNGQIRLEDGTFCRPEPINFTVWADDLFMSVPFLLRMARITGEQKYYDDAAKQVVNFRKYLLDTNGLYKHGWFSHTQERSKAYWGRANGWIVWATAELLTWLPTSHKEYKTVLSMFKEHIGKLVTYQEPNGMWHQLLNRKDSYEETSCTALFTLAIARGVRKGWLPKDYKKYAVNGWNAVKSKIDEDGTVHGICRGTEIGFDDAFYMNRPTIDHDPRGLGAVITAGVEISKLK